MALRVHQPGPLTDAAELDLDAAGSRHVQVRRLQPGDRLVVFDGAGLQWPAEVLEMGRRGVRVRLGAGAAGTAELALQVTLAVGMPANERMDALVEKAAELGAAAIQPLQAARSVLRLEGDRAQRRQAHWQAVAVAACEQCGRTRVLQVLPVRACASWLAELAPAASATSTRLLLSTQPGAPALASIGLPAARPGAGAACVLSGPEGGFDAAEQAAAAAAGFQPCSLGPRVLRADTAPLAALAWLALACG